MNKWNHYYCCVCIVNCINKKKKKKSMHIIEKFISFQVHNRKIERKIRLFFSFFFIDEKDKIKTKNLQKKNNCFERGYLL